MSRMCTFLVLAIAVMWTSRAAAQCELVQGEDEVLGWGTSVRMAVDPVTEEPVVIYDVPGDGLRYRHFYGPEWGLEVKVDTGGILLPQGVGNVMHHAVDLVMDDYGRPRVALADLVGVYHTRYTSGWSAPETILPLALGEPELGGIQLRFERDDMERAHVNFWTSAYDGSGRRSYHMFDGGAGFGEATHYDGGWTARGRPDSQGNLHVVNFDSFSDPDNPNGLHQYQAYYWKWTIEGGWPEDEERITDEPNPPEGNGAGPLGFSPTIEVGPGDRLVVPYPMHETDDAANGEMHVITNDGSGWSEPTNLFPTNGHGGKPVIAIDRHGTTMVIGLVYEKYYSVDYGHGFEMYEEWNSSGSHWQFHDLVETCGLFWHVYVPIYWSNNEPGDITLHTFTKNGTCPGVKGNDLDDDGVDDSVDLCPDVPDPAQWDTDGDGSGDGCDLDDDGDGFDDSVDVCPRLADPDQADTNGDGLGDACSNLVDEDLDGWLEPWECDDTEPNAYPGNDEDCDDGIDNDCDGDVDGADSDCPPGSGDDDDAWDDDDFSGDDEGSWESGDCGCRTDGDGAGLFAVAALLAALAAGRRDR